jgi:hypothetical protein
MPITSGEGLMTEGLGNIGALVEIGKSWGPFGILLVIIWLQQQQYGRILTEHRKYMDEIRDMYLNNVKLVKDYESVACDLKDLVVLNTQVITGLTHDIRENQFCPALRIEKKTVQIAGGKNL